MATHVTPGSIEHAVTAAAQAVAHYIGPLAFGDPRGFRAAGHRPDARATARAAGDGANGRAHRGTAGGAPADQ